MISSLTELFLRARSDGIIRPDAEPQDVAAIFAMLGVAYDLSDSSQPEAWRRYLALMLDGLRAGDRPALPAPLLAAVDEILATGKHRARSL